MEVTVGRVRKHSCFSLLSYLYSYAWETFHTDGRYSDPTVAKQFLLPEWALLMAALGDVFSFLSPCSLLRCRTNHLSLFLSFQQPSGSPPLFFSSHLLLSLLLMHAGHYSAGSAFGVGLLFSQLLPFLCALKNKACTFLKFYFNRFIVMRKKMGIYIDSKQEKFLILRNMSLQLLCLICSDLFTKIISEGRLDSFHLLIDVLMKATGPLH